MTGMMCGLRNWAFFIILTFSFLTFCSGEDILERMAAIEGKVEKLQEQNIQKDRRIGSLETINVELVTEVQALRVSLKFSLLRSCSKNFDRRNKRSFYKNSTAVCYSYEIPIEKVK